ncbi:MAG: hypothetical protein SNJ71_02230 [Bacteroidales bacterium]
MNKQLPLYHKILSVIFFIICSNLVSYSATITAVASGDWNVPATWGGTLPVNGDDVIIPAGITVTVPPGYNSGDLTTNLFGTLNVYGTLNVARHISFNQWEPDVLTIKTGGRINITNNLSFSANNAGMAFNIENGGELYINGQLTDCCSGPKPLNNYGYIEIFGNINIAQITINNFETGIILIHGSVTGSGSTAIINNFGIITTDLTLTLNNLRLDNKVSGRILVFGDIIMTGSGVFINDGFVQTNTFDVQNVTTFSNTGTLVILNELDEDYGGCPCNSGIAYVDPSKITVNTNPNCGYPSCLAHWTATSTPISPGRRLWLAADFIGYGLSQHGDKIARWFDLANNYGFKMSEPVVAKQPTLNNNATHNLNYNPTMNFTGSDIHLDLDANYPTASAGDGGIAIFAVVVPNAAGDPRFISDFGFYADKGVGLAYSTNNTKAYTPTTYGGNNTTLAHGRGTTPTLVSMTVNFGAGGSQSVFYNGTSAFTNAITLTALTSTQVEHVATPGEFIGGPFTLGAQAKKPDNIDRDFEGNIAEYILYARSVTATEAESNQSFLALKYGITLPHNYRNYGGAIVYNITGYANDIIGLAREDLNFLHQRISTSINNPDELVISTNEIAGIINKKDVTTRIAANGAYLVMGHNGNSLASNNRVYKITSTNFTQTVKMRFKYAGLSSAPFMQIADDAAFTVNVQVISGTYSDPYISYSTSFGTGTKYMKMLIPVTVNDPGVGINTTSIHQTAALHVHSTDKGILVPALASPTAITDTYPNPPTGTLFFNTTHNRFMYNAGTPATPEWKFVGEPLKQTTAELTTATGYYIGELRYNTTDNKMYIWDGTVWRQLKE